MGLVLVLLFWKSPMGLFWCKKSDGTFFGAKSPMGFFSQKKVLWDLVLLKKSDGI